MMGGRQADELMWLAPDRPHQLSRHHAVADRNAGRYGNRRRDCAAARGRWRCPPIARRTTSPSRSGDKGATVGTGRMARDAGDFRRFMASPEADGAVLATAAALRQVRKMGEGSGTDLLIVGLSATDYVGHGVGTEGAEMCLQMTGLDRELGDFFARLDATGIDYVVALTADHGGHDMPERNRQNAWPAAAARRSRARSRRAGQGGRRKARPAAALALW